MYKCPSCGSEDIVANGMVYKSFSVTIDMFHGEHYVVSLGEEEESCLNDNVNEIELRWVCEECSHLVFTGTKEEFLEYLETESK